MGIMATLVYSISSKTDKVTGLHEVLIRFFHGRLNQRAKSGIFTARSIGMMSFRGILYRSSV